MMSRVAFVAVPLVLTMSGCSGSEELSAPAPDSTSTTDAILDPSGSPGPVPDPPETAPEQQVAKGKDQSFALKNQPGSARGCVDVDGEVSVRSGQFLAGPWDQFRDGPEGGIVSMYVVPEHARAMSEVTVGGSAGNRRFSVASGNLAEAGDYRYYAVDVDRPASGTWTITAAAGDLAGCWVVDVS
ncbi:hypothetical protein BH09ACT11_BH09ACT11_07920 [soil metagenome]